MNRLSEIAISVSVVLILCAFLLNEQFLMPMGMQMFLIVALLILFLALIAFLFKENSRDERELIHTFAAGRISFIAGSITLIGGMIYGIFQHDIDLFLPITLVVMILSKVLYRMYSDSH